MSPVVLGLDIGTQSTKALLLDASSGTVLGRGSNPHTVLCPRPGAAEQEPSSWLDAVAAATREALTAACVDASSIAAVGVSGQQHGLVLLGGDGGTLRPAKLWCDTESHGEAAELSAASGCVQTAAFTASKILWVKRREPEVWAATRSVLLPKDYVVYSLTGVLCCEPSDASGTGLFDETARAFDAAACARLDARLLGPSGDARGGGPGALFPRCAGSPDEAVGFVTESASKRFGIPAGVPVAAGGGDNACAALGVGVCEPGTLISGTLFCVADAPLIPRDASGAVAPFCDAAGGFLPLLCTLNCAAVAAEARAAHGLSTEDAEAAAFASLSARAAASPSSAASAASAASALLFLPYLIGERTPNWPTSTGALIGLRPGSLGDKGAVYLAAVEGAILSLRAGYNRLIAGGVPNARRLLLVGGCAASGLWRRIACDAFALPVVVSSEPEAAARGAAVCAAAVATRETVKSCATRLAPAEQGDMLLPDAASAAFYLALLKRFTLASEALYGVGTLSTS